jgi:hypothetical protein
MISEVRFKPITKNFDIDQNLRLAQLAFQHPVLDEFKDAALQTLPQATRKTRLELTSRFQNAFLEVKRDRIRRTPALHIWASSEIEQQAKRQLLYIYYLRAFPLAWYTVKELILPRAGNGLGSSHDPEIPQEEWDSFLERYLVPCADSTFDRTRNHLTAHLTKFSMLESRSEPGDRFNKKFFANPTQPLVEIFWLSLGLEFADNAWTSRTFEFIQQESWTRIAFCSPSNYVNWALEEAERSGLGYSDYYGSEKQFTWRSEDVDVEIANRMTGESPCSEGDR